MGKIQTYNLNKISRTIEIEVPKGYAVQLYSFVNIIPGPEFPMFESTRILDKNGVMQLSATGNLQKGLYKYREGRNFMFRIDGDTKGWLE